MMMNQNIKDVDLARLAAYIDGEGTITISHFVRKGEPRPYSHLTVAVSNSDVRLPEWCKEITGMGSVVRARGMGYEDGRNWKAVYSWSCTSRRAFEIIRSVYPYLLIKKDRAEIAMAFQELVLPKSKVNKGVPPENLEKRLTLITSIRDLNKRGRGAA